MSNIHLVKEAVQQPVIQQYLERLDHTMLHVQQQEIMV